MRVVVVIVLLILAGCTQTRIVYVFPEPVGEEELDEAIDEMLEVCRFDP